MAEQELGIFGSCCGIGTNPGQTSWCPYHSRPKRVQTQTTIPAYLIAKLAPVVNNEIIGKLIILQCYVEALEKRK